MKKLSIAKKLLKLNRETIRRLTLHESSLVRGGEDVTEQPDVTKTTTSNIACTGLLADCAGIA